MNHLIKSYYLFVVSLMFFTTLGINLDAVAESRKVEIKKPPSDVGVRVKSAHDDDGDAYKVKAKLILCGDDKMGTTYACGYGGCPDDPAIEVKNSQGTTSICTLNCDGISPDANNDCDCPFAIAEDGGSECNPPL